MRGHSASIVLLLVLPFSQGCYSYQTTQLSNLQRGEQIRVVLEEDGFRRVVPGAARSASPRFEGRFSGSTDDSLTVSVWIGEAYRGTPFEAAYEDIMIPRVDLQRVEHRRLSKPRTAVAAAGIVAGIVVLIESIGVVNFLGNGGESGPPDPPLPVGIGGMELERPF
jgi:hypothetical protein